MSGVLGNLTDMQAKAFLRMHNDPNIKHALLPLLNEVKDSLLQKSLYESGPDLHRTQGQIIVIQELFETIEKAGLIASISSKQKNA